MDSPALGILTDTVTPPDGVKMDSPALGVLIDIVTPKGCKDGQSSPGGSDRHSDPPEGIKMDSPALGVVT